MKNRGEWGVEYSGLADSPAVNVKHDGRQTGGEVLELVDEQPLSARALCRTEPGEAMRGSVNRGESSQSHDIDASRVLRDHTLLSSSAVLSQHSATDPGIFGRYN